MCVALDWDTNGISGKNSNCSIATKTATLSVLKADDEIKLEEEYSHVILLVSILYSVSNRFVCYFRLFRFTLGKSRLNTVYASDRLPERLPVSLEVVRIYF